MLKVPQHTIRLQDGTLFTFERKVSIPRNEALLDAFGTVHDGRSASGKRYSLSFILLLLFYGITRGSSTIKECRLDALHDASWFHQVFPRSVSIPAESAIEGAIQKVDIESLIHECMRWKYLLYGIVDKTASFDGKTMNGIHQKDAIKHILSLFTHESHQIMGQIGVTQKENEIPAFHRLLEQVKNTITGMLLVGDALHTQTGAIEDILSKDADYLLFAKGNQETLFNDLAAFFADPPFGTKTEEAVDYDVRGGRNVTTMITVSYEEKICEYLGQNGWKEVATVGKIKRTGTRTTSDGHTTLIDETYYLISSHALSATQVLEVTRGHWCIENNLHWEKDWAFLEDRQTLRRGAAPQVMTFLRSFAISLFNLWSFSSPTDAIHNFQRNRRLHHLFLKISGVTHPRRKY